MTDYVQLAQHIRVEGALLAKALLQWDSLRSNHLLTAEVIAEIRWRIPQLKGHLEAIEQSWEWRNDVTSSG